MSESVREAGNIGAGTRYISGVSQNIPLDGTGRSQVRGDTRGGISGDQLKKLDHDPGKATLRPSYGLNGAEKSQEDIRKQLDKKLRSIFGTESTKIVEKMVRIAN